MLNSYDISYEFIRYIVRVVVVALICVPLFSFAQADRSYYYESISQKFTVNKDTTVDVEETQTYHFSGEYHQGWRSIPLNKVSDITDIQVFDGATLQPYQNSFSALDKTNPASWGKYHISRSGGNVNIEWYYSAKDESRAWILKYKLIGALTFLENKDELYWNLFTDFSVPVNKVIAKVYLPLNNYSVSDLQSELYVSGAEHPGKGIFPEQSLDQYGMLRTGPIYYFFSADNVVPNGVVTIAAGWPKGLIDRGAFWRMWLSVNWWWILSILIVLTTIIIMVLYWFFTEKYHKGRGTIIPEYEPPKNLPPAMAEVIVREKVTPKGWAATVVDLAVRGFVTIEEDQNGFFGGLRLLGAVVPLIVFFFVFVFMGGKLGQLSHAPVANVAIMLVFFALMIFILLLRFKNISGSSLMPKDYVIVLKKEFDSPSSGLHDYEKEFLHVLLVGGRFSTRAMRWNKGAARELYKAMQELEKDLYKEAELDTGAYEKPISKDRYSLIGLFVLIFGGVFLIPFGAQMSDSGGAFLYILILAALCALVLFLFVKFEARLSKEGAILREEWLGFKLYLETAEKYRMRFDDAHREQGQIRADLFEKYLPYAIILGVEKKWGKAFEGISMPPPNWLVVSGVHGVEPYAGGTGAGNLVGPAGQSPLRGASFSASAFSASFASSFTSAFSSSGGAGASGGGGGAGGGGGGGGGGAS